jgi:hypothetical protein
MNFNQQMNYKIKVVVEKRDGQIIFQQEVEKPEDLIKVAEVLPKAIESFDSANNLILSALFNGTDNEIPF